MNREESGKALVVACILVVLFAGFAASWLYYKDYAAAADLRDKALRSAEIELEAETLNRETAALALRELKATVAAQPSLDDGQSPAHQLIRKMTELQLALGQTAEAWESIAPYASTTSAAGEDVLLGAQACSAIYARRGTQSEGLEALGLAKRHYELSNDADSLFLACLLAYRLTEVADFCELRADLLERGGDSREARALLALSYSLAVHLSERIGFAGGDELQAIADGEAVDDRSRLAKLRLTAREASLAGDLERLQELEDEYEEPPPEIRVVLVEALVGRPGASEEDLREGLERLESALQGFPSYVEARNIAAVIHYALGETALCEGQLRWLLRNAAPGDLRRQNWQSLQR